MNAEFLKDAEAIATRLVSALIGALDGHGLDRDQLARDMMLLSSLGHVVGQDEIAATAQRIDDSLTENITKSWVEARLADAGAITAKLVALTEPDDADVWTYRLLQPVPNT